MIFPSWRCAVTRARLLALALILLCAIPGSFGAPVNGEQARAAVSGWLKKSGASWIPGGHATAHQAADGSTSFYTVPLKPQGYAIVAPDDEIEPIIAFSTVGTFQDVKQNPAVDVMERDLTNRLRRLKDPKVAARDAGNRLARRQRWHRLIATDAAASALQMATAPVTGTSGTITTVNNTIIDDLVVAPLTQSAWNQNDEYTSSYKLVAVYDYYVPPGPDANVNNDPCGCVATCWAQMMYFWKYPTAAVGTGTFQCWNNGAAMTLPLLGGNGSGGPYNWSSMPAVPAYTSITTAQQQAIGALCYDAGVSMNMAYAPGGSGAWLSSETIRSTFQYANASEYWSSNSTWDEPTSRAIRTNLDAGHPAAIAIFGSGEGHEVVADGYGYSQGVMYDHCNFGWGGAQSLWYEFPSTDGPSVPNGPVAYFNTIEQVVFNVDPTTPGEMVTGRIVNSSGTPIVGATATLKNGSSVIATTTTGSTGIYAFKGVASNTSYTVSAQVTGSSIQFVTNPIAVTTGSSDDNGDAVGNQIADFYQSTGSAPAANGTWITAAGGSWVDSLHWSNGGVPGGTGATADFSGVNLATYGIVTLDGTQTVGSMLFNSSDITNGFGWIIAPGDNGVLTLSASSGTPLVSVANGAESVQINAVLSGTQGLEMTGSGELQLLDTNTFTGPVTVLSGTLYTNIQEANNTSTAYGPNSGSRTITVDAGGTLYWDTNNVMAQNGAAASNLPTITLNGGTLTSSRYNAIGNVVLTGGTLNGASADSGYYQAFQLLGSVTVNGSAGSVLNSDNTEGDQLLGGSSNTFNVAPTNSGGPDLLVTTSLGDGSGDYWGSGSLIKTGAGVMELTAPTTYTGATTVNGGTLCVTSSCASGSLVKVNAGATLSGTGTVGPSVTISSGGTLAPGMSGTGALSISGSLTLSGSTVMDINAVTGGCTAVQATSKIKYGGALVVNAIAGTPVAGQSFTLFSAASYSGSFSSVTLPSLPGTLQWSTATLATNGQIEATLSPWGSWLSQNFTGAQMGNSAISGEAAMPNGDGVANILKFATGMTPYSGAPLPVTESIATVSGSNYLELTVTKNPAATDLTYTVQVNGSLTSATWSSAGTTIVANTSTTLIVRDNTPMFSAQQRFIRLQVTGP